MNRRPLVLAKLLFALGLLIACLATGAAAPPPPDAPDSAVVNAAPAPDERLRASDWLTTAEQNLSIAVLVFGTVVLLIQFVTLRSVTQSNPELVIRAYAVTLIVVCTLFLVSAGLSSNQIAPAIGLFGTLAGYLLGRAGKQEGSNKQPEE